ncbi:MAG: PDZ domain-containing protein [Deltaproteobacteria bacterium]|nr:PDZ domain-containing protein [Deltaproteobacteria bacterium]MBW2305973.1 PDZ domain-containing protein [Deltaproteobacteria bacterium]
MIWIFKRYFWAVNLLWITGVAYLCSDIFLHVIDSRLDISISPRMGSQVKKESKKAVRPESQYMSIMERNLFDPSARDKKKEPAPPEPAAIQQIPEDIKPTSVKMALRGTITPLLLDGSAPDNPLGTTNALYQREARAIIEDLSTRTQSIYSINQTVEDRKIVAIKRTEVILAKPDGSLERLIMDFDKKPRRRFPSRKRKSTPRPKPSSSLVEKISANSYAVSREELMRNVQNMSQFLTQLRVRPHFQDGQPNGFLVTNIRRGTLVEQLGLRNGDIIKRVNGETMNRPDELFQAYQQLQNENMIQLEIERKGQVQTLSYTIR